MHGFHSLRLAIADSSVALDHPCIERGRRIDNPKLEIFRRSLLQILATPAADLTPCSMNLSPLVTLYLLV
ncbi:hypothetical protein RchiOBHm_Chr2g0152721 [Rosa chinensis]|nr:hypothetical protein RchiOBHm_Chr2g0152721 [Rosa chinensis]